MPEKGDVRLIQVVKGEGVGIQDGKSRVYFFRVSDGHHLVEAERPGSDFLMQITQSTADLEIITSVMYVEIDGNRRQLSEVLRENEIFEERPKIH